MSVNNGDPANEQTFNDGFPSRTDDTSSAGQYTFQKVTDSTSPSTGGVTMDGGLGVAKNANIGGVLAATQIKGTVKAYAEQVVSASGSINFEVNQSIQYRRLSGDGGPIVVAALPFGADPSALVDGAQFTLVGMDSTNDVRINHNDVQYGIILWGDAILKKYYKLVVSWDAVLERFVEDGRNF